MYWSIHASRSKLLCSVYLALKDHFDKNWGSYLVVIQSIPKRLFICSTSNCLSFIKYQHVMQCHLMLSKLNHSFQS